MKYKQFLVGFFAFGLLFVAGCTAQNQDGQAAIYNPNPAVLTPEATPKTVQPPSPVPPVSPKPPVTKTGPVPLYADYTLARYASLKGKQPFVLFFQTATCLTCKKLNTDILAKLPTFPRGTQILKVAFDKEASLLKTFAVTTKGTVIVLDKLGKVRAKLVNPTVDQLLAAVYRAL